MTTSIKILTTATLDSSPALVITAPDGSKTLINCGEGCQRSFLESSPGSSGALKVKSVKRVCLTGLGPDAVGGLPGFVLTAADASQIALSNNIKAIAQKNNGSTPNSSNSMGGNGKGKKRKNRQGVQSDNNTDSASARPTLDVFGPHGTRTFLHSLRHFMRRDKFAINIHEGRLGDNAEDNNDVEFHAKKPKKQSSGAESAHDVKAKKDKSTSSSDPNAIGVEAIPLTFNQGSKEGSFELPACSYIFTTPPTPGKFRADKAKALGIPPGPIYGKLKSGQTVTYVDKATGEERTANPEDVVEKGLPGIAFAVLCVPNIEILGKFKQEAALKQRENKNRPTLSEEACSDDDLGPPNRLELMVHICPRSLFETKEYQDWMNQFHHDNMDHLTLHTMDGFTGGNEEYDGSIFRSAAIVGAMTRAEVCADVYLPTLSGSDGVNAIETVPEYYQASDKDESKSSNDDDAIPPRYIVYGRSSMEYTLLPMKRRGLHGSTSYKNYYKEGVSPDERDEIHSLVKESGCLETSRIVIQECQNLGDKSISSRGTGELIFTGTGSALPCKHRNVTGKCMRMENGKAILLDCGEGTTGQLLRCWKHKRERKDENSDENISARCQRFRQHLVDIKAVFISHPHADHHVGICRLLAERAKAVRHLMGQHRNEDQLVLMAPTALCRFLAEYESIEPRIRGSYVPLDCRDMLCGGQNPLAGTLQRSLGISSCFSVPVTHCRDSFAIVFRGDGWGKVVYSGDCRPSDRLAQWGCNADILIHEATFEDGMEAEAALKRHSTVGEALMVGRKMNAKAVVLTHFSQRYPRIPPLNSDASTSLRGPDGAQVPIIFAFDFMRLRPDNLVLAGKLTPSIRLLYPEENSKSSSNKSEEEDDVLMDGSLSTDAKDLLSTPGAFAASCM